MRPKEGTFHSPPFPNSPTELSPAPCSARQSISRSRKSPGAHSSCLSSTGTALIPSSKDQEAVPRVLLCRAAPQPTEGSAARLSAVELRQRNPVKDRRVWVCLREMLSRYIKSSSKKGFRLFVCISWEPGESPGRKTNRPR